MKPLLRISLVTILFANACKPAATEPVKDTGGLENDNSAIILKDTLGPDIAKRLVKNYGSRVYQRHQGELLQSDTRCVWFSSQQLESLLTRIKTEGGNGVRFYMATYDKDAAPGINCPEKYRDYSTLVMVSTRDSITPNGDTLHFDYYNKGGKLRGGILTTTPENRGEICPPPSNCSADGATLLDGE
jgi:hypothetical protein